MFTGIVEIRGRIAHLEARPEAIRVRIEAPGVMEGVRPGDSIAVNGVCLTVVDPTAEGFDADVMQETMRRSSLGDLQPGGTVNLERAVRASDRLGGHIVQGHVDCTGTIASIDPREDWTMMRIDVPEAMARYMVEKGSICVDGVSLTIVSIDDSGFTVSLIPTTLAETTLGTRNVGDRVNIEVDVLAKYVERLLESR
ncbi:MAG: riboflavin synthase [Actinobacteria bacterium]|nr:riboflavin synthase [Actinomycetota bacterium]